uniref:Aminotransferase-like plant mobile domain-containing protein n=1 Tax=Oryza punctata TaxID=4537 RepID=A0A0E0M5M9_ORYPU
MPASWNLEDPGESESRITESQNQEPYQTGPQLQPQWARIQVHNVYEYFTESFESLRDNEVRWTPYTNEEANLRAPNGVSILCYRDEAYWMTRKILVYDIFVEGQKRQADNRYRRSMHFTMTPSIEAWSQALNDVIHETRAYDHNIYEQYMAWGFQFLTPLLGSMQTDIAGELVREVKTLWEKLRDGIAGTNQEVMAAVDSLRRKGKRIMRLASCRHSSDVYTTATSRRTFEQMPERPSTSSRPSTSARPSASTRRSTDGRAALRSTSVRDAPTIPTIPEITQMSERLEGFGQTQGTSQGIPTLPRVDVEFIGQGGFTSLGGPTQSIPLHAPTYGTKPWQGQSIDYGGSFRSELMAGFRPYTSSYGDMSSFGGGSSSVPNELRASQTDDAPQMTQPTQLDDGDLQGNIHDPCRSNRERHEPNRLSFSGPRHAVG